MTQQQPPGPAPEGDGTPHPAHPHGATPLSYQGADADGRAPRTEPAGDGERAWWDDPRMPWQGEPTRADRRCWAAFMLLGLYGLAMIPLRWLILGQSSYLATIVNGSQIGLIDIGAAVRLGQERHWPIWVVVAALSVMKFDWIFWWAGKLWGDGIIRMLGARSRWAARTARHTERLATRFGVPAVFGVWLLQVFPQAIVFAFVGGAGMRLRTFLLADFAGALVNRALFLYLGYRLGEPAKDVVEQIGRYSLWISLALTAYVVWRSTRGSKDDDVSGPGTGGDEVPPAREGRAEPGRA